MGGSTPEANKSHDRNVNKAPADTALAGEETIVPPKVESFPAQADGTALQYASDPWTGDREVVLAAVSVHGSALRYASAAGRKAGRSVGSSQPKIVATALRAAVGRSGQTESVAGALG